MNLTTLELDTIYFYFIKLGHFIPTGSCVVGHAFIGTGRSSLVGHVFTGTSWSSGVGHVFFWYRPGYDWTFIYLYRAGLV